MSYRESWIYKALNNLWVVSIIGMGIYGLFPIEKVMFALAIIVGAIYWITDSVKEHIDQLRKE